MKTTLDEILNAVERNDMTGFCVACGEEASTVEPDAQMYQCAKCGQFAVYGAEELLLRGEFSEEGK